MKGMVEAQNTLLANKNMKGKYMSRKEKEDTFITEKNLDSNFDEMEITDEEKFEIASKRVLKKYHKAFEELAK